MNMATRQNGQGIAAYLRVSTDDLQNPENSFEYQRQRILECIERRAVNLPVVQEYTDILSGKTGQRPHYQQMLADARTRGFSQNWHPTALVQVRYCLAHLPRLS
jgi:DNA invertase Pin-like site-specific DNA recombinase